VNIEKQQTKLQEQVSAFQNESVRKQNLQNKVQYAKQVVPGCNISGQERLRIDRVLAKASNEIYLRDNLTGGESLLNSVTQQLINCGVEPAPNPIEPTTIAFAPRVSLVFAASFSGAVLFTITGIFFRALYKVR